MWYSPRRTIKSIIKTNPQRHLSLLGALIGIYSILDQLSTRHTGDFLIFPLLLVLILIGGPLIGIALIQLIGRLLHWAGSKLGGKAPLEHLQSAYAWSWIPNIWILSLWLLKLLLLGPELFTSTNPNITESHGLTLALSVFNGIGIITSFWTFILLVVTVSEVQRFSYWRGFSSILLSLLIIFLPTFGILALISGFYIRP